MQIAKSAADVSALQAPIQSLENVKVEPAEAPEWLLGGTAEEAIEVDDD